MTTPDILRALLLATILVMALISFLYLGRRSLHWGAYIAWGLLAVLIPILGPILVIGLHPGIPRRAKKQAA